jgi:hypothetical protein
VDLARLLTSAQRACGQRTGVRDANDRYANLEVSYLLDRLETFADLAILASNARVNLDPSQRKRIRPVVTLRKVD